MTNVSLANHTKRINSANGKNIRRSLLQVVTSWQLYVMALPTMALLFVFSYWPMFGTILAFKKYKVKDGIFGSAWMTPLFRNFQALSSADAHQAIRNTLFLNFMFIIVGTAFSLALALMFNEVRHRTYKKITQSLSFLPFFISSVVIGIFASGLLNYENGSINGMLASLGREKIGFFMEAQYWPLILLIVTIWKGAGYNSVVYLATIAGVDAQLYEAAKIDGASRWGEMWHISLPMLRPTVIVLTLLAIGRIMNADFGLFYNVTQDMPTLYSTTDVIDTYVYRLLRKRGDIGISTAVGLFQSTISFALVLLSNFVARKIDDSAALF
ncbi:sugar ABC transporter permease [Clostridia bacterium]|nr:sugar ABC transporter permease [Clostridia bacterium]